ncbi:MAG: hypothetical protein V1843_01310 [bacterium]
MGGLCVNNATSEDELARYLAKNLADGITLMDQFGDDPDRSMLVVISEGKDGDTTAYIIYSMNGNELEINNLESAWLHFIFHSASFL